MPIRPPGLSTRAISSKTAGLSCERLIAQLEITTSTEASGTGSCSICAGTNSTFSSRADRLAELARATISPVMSTPMTLPYGPTRAAARKESTPDPDPRSRTVSPGVMPATATGLPHPQLADTARLGSDWTSAGG
jgi:hypothetical protein